jgi:hypothetical protein
MRGRHGPENPGHGHGCGRHGSGCCRLGRCSGAGTRGVLTVGLLAPGVGDALSQEPEETAIGREDQGGAGVEGRSIGLQGLEELIKRRIGGVGLVGDPGSLGFPAL